MLALVCSVCVLLSLAGFIVFLVGSWQTLKTLADTAKASNKVVNAASSLTDTPAGGGGPAALGPSVAELTALINSVDSAFATLTKAGPVLAGLLASILFMAVAAWAATSEHPADTSAPTCVVEKATPLSTESGLLMKDVPVRCSSAPGLK